MREEAAVGFIVGTDLQPKISNDRKRVENNCKEASISVVNLQPIGNATNSR
jgi:hypothetical protein